MALVTIPFRQGNRVQVQVEWRPKWGPAGELPVSVHEYSEGRIEVFATGMFQVVLTVLPIIVRIAVRAVGRHLRLAVCDAVRREMAMALRRISTAPGSSPVSGPGASDAGSWPNLWEYLTAEVYPDGSARQKSSMVIVAGPQGWQGCLSDKDNGRVMWKTSDTVEGLLLALEEGAASDDPSAWRQATSDKFKGKKRS